MSSESSSRRTTPPPFDTLRDEVNAITRWWSKIFFFLSVVLRQDYSSGANAAKGQQVSGRSSYAVVPCKDDLRMISVQGASESTSESRSSGEMDVKGQEQGQCHLTSNSTFGTY